MQKEFMFRELSGRGNVLSGKYLSWKMFVREVFHRQTVSRESGLRKVSVAELSGHETVLQSSLLILKEFKQINNLLSPRNH